MGLEFEVRPIKFRKFREQTVLRCIRVYGQWSVLVETLDKYKIRWFMNYEKYLSNKNS